MARCANVAKARRQRMTETNKRNADAAEIALIAYIDGNDCDKNDTTKELLTDLVTNIGHLADVYEIDFIQLVETATEHYRYESRTE